MSNPYFYTEVGGTTPLDVILIDGNGAVVTNFQGASVDFQFLDPGGDVRFERAAEIVDDATGHVRYTWLAGDLLTEGRYLGAFIVTYSIMDVQRFPSNRYIEVIVE